MNDLKFASDSILETPSMTKFDRDFTVMDDKSTTKVIL